MERDLLNSAKKIANLIKRIEHMDSQIQEVKNLYATETGFYETDIFDLTEFYTKKRSDIMLELEDFMWSISPRYTTHENLKDIVVYDEKYNDIKIIVSYADWGLTKQDVIQHLKKFVVNSFGFDTVQFTNFYEFELKKTQKLLELYKKLHVNQEMGLYELQEVIEEIEELEELK